MVFIKINRKILFLVFLSITLLCAVRLVFLGNPYELVHTFYQQDNKVNADMEFRVKYIIEEMDGAPGHLPLSDKSYVSIKNARIILIDDRTGEILSSGLTDEKGEWKTNVTVSQDPRFRDKNMGTVTVITVADGFNETIHFNVSVNEYAPLTSGDIIVLHPINLKGRSEPSFDAVHLHRLTVFRMLDDYAEMIGLKRQSVFQKVDVPPWSPRLKN